MTKINVGLIGLGRVSQLAYLNNLSTIKKINSISICDKNLDLLSKVAKKYKIKKTYSNFLDMLKKEELDIVFVIVNRFLVEKISKKILNDDKNIILFSEKPFAQSYKKAKELVNIARKKKKDFLVGYMKRCDTGLKYIKSNINSFKLGKITSIDYFSFDGNSYDPNTKYIKYNFKTKKKNNPKLKYLNTQCHSLNLLKYMFGEIKLEHKNIDRSTGEGVVTFKTKKNLNISLINKFNKLTPWYERMIIFYDKGVVNIEIPAPFYKNKCAKIKIISFDKKKTFVPKFKNKKWSFKSQVDLAIQYTLSKRINKNFLTQSELCFAKNSANELKIIDNIFKK
jgi:predicted dehydrogenase